MKLKITLILVFCLCCLNITYAQPDTCAIPGPIAADYCIDACIYCDLDYNGYSGTSSGYTPDGGAIFCGAIHNNQWFAFVALTTTVEFTVIADTCLFGNGLQAVIYPDCNPNSAFIACNGGVSGGGASPVVVTATNLTVGQIYWLSVDGWAGDKCEFDLSVTQGSTSPPLLNSIGPITGDTCIYPGGVSTYNISDLPGPPSPNYTWTWPAGVTASASGTSLMVNWGTSGGQICVQASNFCNTSPLTCIDVFIHNTTPTELVEVLCEGDCYTIGNNDYCTTGYYSETLANEHGCDSIVNLNLTYHPVVEATGENFVHCSGESVVLAPQIINGIAPYTYLWDTGETSPDITVTSFNSITHTVTVTDFCGTIDEVDFNITALELPEAFLEDYILICASNPVGFINVEFTGPGPWDLTFLLNGVLQVPITNITDNPFELNVTEPGEYELVSVNNNDCLGFAYGTALVELIFVELFIIGENPSCFGMENGSVDLSIIQGIPPYDYTWNNGAGNIEDLFDLGEGIYSVTVTDGFGCTADTSLVLTEPELMTTNVSTAGELLCFGDTAAIIDLTVNGGTTPYTYQWNNGSSEQDPDSISGGIYFVTVTDANDCTALDSISISAPPEITAMATWIDVSCNGAANGSIDLSVTGGINPYQYMWSDSSVLEDPSDLAPGQYNVIISDSNSCNVSLSVDINEPDFLMTNAIQIQGVDCNDAFGGSIDLMVSGGTSPYTYLWNNGAGTLEDPNGLAAGIYEVVVTDLNNCTAVDSVEITSSSGVIPNAVLIGMITCNDSEVSLDGSGSLGEGALQFEWYDQGNNLVGDSAIIIVNAPGLYSLIISDSTTGCTAVASLDVMADTIPPVANALVSGLIGCNGDPVVIDGNGSTGNGPITYEWIGPDSNLIGTESSIEVTQTGSYILIVTDTINGCSAEDVVEVVFTTDLPEAIVSVSGFISCSNPSAWIDGSGSFSVGAIDFIWLNDNGDQIGNSETVEVFNPGTYTLLVSNIENGCSSTTSIEVTENIIEPVSAITIDGLLSCINSAVTLDGSNSTGSGTLLYQWFDPLNTLISNDSATNVVTGGLYTLIITDLYNGCTAESTIEVEQEMGLPQVIVSSDGIITCINQNVWLDGSQSSGNGTLEYIWLDDGGTTISTNSSVEVNASGIYFLIVTDLSNGCTAQMSIEVELDTDLPDPVATANGIINCIDQNVELDGSASSGFGTLDFMWFNMNGDLLGMNETVLVSAAGLYTLVITDQQNGCTSQTEVEVLENINEPVPDIIADDILTCANVNVTLDGGGSSGTGTLEFEWLDPDSIPIGTNATVNVDAPGTYLLIITDTQNGCTVASSFDLIQDAVAPDAIALTTDSITCISTSVEINGGNSSGANALTFEWFDAIGNSIGTDAVVDVNMAGTFELLVTDVVNGCSASTVITVSGNPDIPIAVAEVSGSITCVETMVTLDGSLSSGSGPLSYEWFDMAGSLIAQTSSTQVDQAGDYNLLVTNESNGCTAEMLVIVNEDIQSPIAVGEALNILSCTNASATLDGSNSTASDTMVYEWFNDIGALISTSQNVEVNAGGQYTLVVTNLVNGCTSETSVTVEQESDVPVVDAQVSGLLTCLITQVDLLGDASTGSGPLTYNWFDENSLLIGTTSTIFVDQPGDYTLQITDNNNGCSAETNITVQQNTEEPIAIIIDPDTLDCSTAAVSLDGSNSSGNGLLNFEWYDELNMLIGNTTAISANIAGTYTLVVTDDFNGCSSSVEVVVDENADPPLASIQIPGILTCLDNLIELDGSSSTGIGELTYEWYDELNMLIGNDPAIQVSSPGIYTLIITDAFNHCSATANVEVLQNIIPPIADAGLNDTINCNQNTVTLDGSGSGGNGALVYEWSDEFGNIISNEVSIQVVQAGMYSLSVVADNGCIASDQVEIFLGNDVPVADAGPNGILNCNTAQLTLGGSQTSTGNSINYEWLDESALVIGTNINLSVNNPGLYLLVVTDTDNGCVMTDTVLVDENIEVPLVDTGPGGILTCEITTINLGGPGSSTGPEFSYEWLNSSGNVLSTDATFIVTSPDSYTLQISNTSNGCTASSEIQVTEDTTNPIADAGLGGTITCDISSIFLNGNNSGGNNLLFEWYDETQMLIGNSAIVEVSEAGIFTLLVTNTVNGCSDSDTVGVILDGNLPEAIAMVNDVLTCTVSLVTLDGSASSSPGSNLTFEWFDPGNQLISVLETVDVNIPGVYTLIISDTQNGCTATTSVQVDQDIGPPSAEAGEDLLLTCGNDEVTLSGSGSGAINLSFEWFDDNNNSLGNTASLEVSSAGIYSLLVTNTENGCTAVDQMEVLVDTNVPVAEAGIGGTLTCIISELLLDGSASSSGSNMVYEWQDSAGNTLGNSSTILINETGAYTLFVTDTLFNCTAQDEVIVDENITSPVALIDLIGALSCTDQSLVLNAGSSLPAGDLTFTWSTLGGNIISGVNTPNPEIDEPGTYLVVVTDVLNGCTDTTTILITQNNQLPEVNIDSPSILTCAVTQVELNAFNSSQGSDFVYSWTSVPPGGIVSGENTLSPLINQSALYTLTILNTVNGCENSATVPVDEDLQAPIAEANVEGELDCLTEAVQLNGDGSSLGPTYTYNWSGPNVIDGANSLLATVNSSGTYTLLVTDIMNGCTQTDAVFVEENVNVPVAIEGVISPSLCFGDQGSIEILFTEGGQAPYLYSIDGGLNFQPLQVFNALDPGTYSIIVQDAIGCEYEEQFTLPFVPELYIDLPTELIIQLGETGEIQAYVNIPTSQIDTIIWTPAEGLTCTDCLNPLVNSFVETLYMITVIDENGCEVSNEIMFRVDKERAIYIPNAFSPHNADGINDYFMIYSQEGIVKSINSFQVFNRWGEMVFGQKDFMPNDPAAAWDGFFRGEPLQPGVFVYWAEIEFIDGFKKLYKGDVTLMR